MKDSWSWVRAPLISGSQQTYRTIGQKLPLGNEDDNEYVYGHLDKETDKKDEPTWRCHQNPIEKRMVTSYYIEKCVGELVPSMWQESIAGGNKIIGSPLKTIGQESHGPANGSPDTNAGQNIRTLVRLSSWLSLLASGSKVNWQVAIGFQVFMDER